MTVCPSTRDREGRKYIGHGAATLTGRRSLFSDGPDAAPGAAPGPEEGRVEAGASLPEDEAAEAEDIPGPGAE